MKTMWTGTVPDKCPLCSQEMLQFDMFVESRIKKGSRSVMCPGSRSVMCPECYKQVGWYSPTGRHAQVYDRQTLRRLEWGPLEGLH
jgi:hypothetical protein